MSKITTIRFRIRGRHESHAGQAVVVSDYWQGVVLGMYNLPESPAVFKTIKIGIQDGYDIYECYRDSGSDDYVYFAVKKEQ